MNESARNVLVQHTNDVNCVTIEKGIIYYGCSDKTLYRRDEKGEKTEVHKHNQIVTCLDSTDGLVVSGGLDGNVKTSDGVEFPSKLVVVRSISINSKNKKIAVGGPDGQISILDTSGRCLDSWEGHCDGTVHAIGWLADFLVTGSALGDLRIWETEKKRRLHASKTSIHDKSFSGCGTLALDTNPNKGHIVTVGADNLGHIWRLNESGRRPVIDLVLNMRSHTAPVNCVKYSNDHCLIATGSIDKNICIWTAADGSLIRQIEQHTGSVLSVAWTRDSTSVISGGADKTVRRLYIQSESVQEPPELCCPITHSLMLDCVTADDGNNYSRAGIEEWFAKGSQTSPLTGLPIKRAFVANPTISQRAWDFVNQQQL